MRTIENPATGAQGLSAGDPGTAKLGPGSRTITGLGEIVLHFQGTFRQVSRPSTWDFVRTRGWQGPSATGWRSSHVLLRLPWFPCRDREVSTSTVDRPWLAHVRAGALFYRRPAGKDVRIAAVRACVGRYVGWMRVLRAVSGDARHGRPPGGSGCGAAGQSLARSFGGVTRQIRKLQTMERVVADAPGHKGSLTVANDTRSTRPHWHHRSILTYWKTGDRVF